MIQVEQDKQKLHIEYKMKREELLMMMRLSLQFFVLINLLTLVVLISLALQHMLDCLRHVGPTCEEFKPLEFPTKDLQLPLLNFNTNLPPQPLVMETDRNNFISSIFQLWLTRFVHSSKTSHLSESSSSIADATSSERKQSSCTYWIECEISTKDDRSWRFCTNVAST